MASRTITRRIGAGVAAVAMAASLTGVAMVVAGPAGAAANAFGSALTGTITVGTNPSSPLPGGSFIQGTFDDVTGDLTGDMTFPQATMNATIPDALGGGTAVVTYQLDQVAPLTGTVDLGTGAVSATASLSLKLLSANIAGTDVPLEPCAFEPIPLTLTGQMDEAGVVTFPSVAFTIPPTTGTCGGVAGIINPLVAGDAEMTDVSFDTAATDEPPTTSTTTPPTTTPAPPAAQPVARAASYTG